MFDASAAAATPAVPWGSDKLFRRRFRFFKNYFSPQSEFVKTPYFRHAQPVYNVCTWTATTDFNPVSYTAMTTVSTCQIRTGYTVTRDGGKEKIVSGYRSVEF